MTLDSPLFYTKVECPICGTINEFETIRVGAYNEGERDTDFCPKSIKWRNPKYQKYHPLQFFTATCSSCFYTREFNNKFKEWSKDNNFRTYRLKLIKEKHLSSLSEESSFVATTGRMLDNDNYPNETAILKLLLAAFDEQLNEHPSNLDIGRFYLRIAWMFRHMKSGDSGAGEGGFSPYFEDVRRGVEDISTWTAGLGRNIQYLHDAVEAYLDNHKIPENSPERGGYYNSLDQLKEVENQGRQVIGDLEVLMRASQDNPTGATGNEDASDLSDFDDVLVTLLRKWDGVPRNEMEATRMAVKFYINAYETGKEISHGNQTLQAGYLIAELSRRIGDHDTARQYFNTTIKSGQDYIQEIRGDRTRTVLAKKILEMALAQGKKNLAEAKK